LRRCQELVEACHEQERDKESDESGAAWAAVSRIWRATPFNVPNKEDESGLKKSEKNSGDAARAETDVESFPLLAASTTTLNSKPLIVLF